MGRAIDGYLSNCTVFIDLNGNGNADPGEPESVTGRFGGFILLAAPPGVSAALVINTTTDGCVDTFTGQSPGMLQLVSAAVEAEGGVTYGTAGVITPLTTVAGAYARPLFGST
jgi:hypothetical protein